MTVLSALTGFAALAALLTIIPGLDTALVLRSAISQGRRHAVVTALGINTGALAWGAAAAVGATALLAASQWAYDALRIVGAVYMIVMGVQMLVRTFRQRTEPGETADPVAQTTPESTDQTAATDTRRSLSRSYLRGVGTNLLNPKVGAFYLAVIPQFVPPHANHLVMGLALAMVHNLIGVLWFGAIIASVHRARRLLSRDSVQRWMDRVTGTVLIGFGARLAMSRV